MFIKKEEKEDRENEKKKREGVWEEGMEFLICKPCSENSQSSNIPQELYKHKSGRGGATNGVIGKSSENGENRLPSVLNAMMKRHCEGSLHKWCVREANRVKHVVKTSEELNREAGLAVILTYLKTARRGGSASDFLHDIDFTHLLPGITKSTKNNSRNVFFDLRADTFEVVTTVMQELFRSDKVTELSCTLDKVTVQHRSYTVLITFFFNEGKIYCFLNSLVKMAEDEYDASGTAKMVVNQLKETLGLTRTQLATKLLHFRLVFTAVKYYQNQAIKIL